MKKYISILLILLLIPITTYSKQITYQFIEDNTNILSNNTKEYISTYSTYLKDNNNFDYYVVISNNCNNIDTCSNDIYNKLQISDNGLLITYFKQDRTIKILAGPNTSNYITEDIINKYIDKYIYPYLKLNEYDKGIKNGYSAFYKLICNNYELDSSNIEVYNNVDFITKYKIPILLIITWICSTFAYIFCNIIIRIIDKHNNYLDIILIIISLITNITLLYYAYNIDTNSIYIIILFEIISNYSIFQFKPKHKLKKKRQRK